MIYDTSLRAKAIQVLVVIVSIYAGYYLLSNVVDNLRQMELPFGFGFVKSTAGFDVSWSLIPYDPSMSYGRVYLVGIVNTLLLSALIIAFSTMLGFVVGVMRLSKNLLVAQFSRWYVEFFRNVPLLIQVVFWFIVVFSTLPPPRQGDGMWDLFFSTTGGSISRRRFLSPASAGPVRRCFWRSSVVHFSRAGRDCTASVPVNPWPITTRR